MCASVKIASPSNTLSPKGVSSINNSNRWDLTPEHRNIYAKSEQKFENQTAHADGKHWGEWGASTDLKQATQGKYLQSSCPKVQPAIPQMSCRLSRPGVPGRRVSHTKLGWDLKVNWKVWVGRGGNIYKQVKAKKLGRRHGHMLWKCCRVAKKGSWPISISFLLTFCVVINY